MIYYSYAILCDVYHEVDGGSGDPDYSESLYGGHTCPQVK